MNVYAPRGLLAVAPQAIGMPMPAVDPSPGPSRCGNIAVVDICGPLAHDAGQAMMSYGAIRRAVREAIAMGVTVVVLRMHTPGGEVSGAFDCARGIAADCKAAGVQLVAFTDSMTASAGYGIAAVADAIVLSDTATIGSIGVIAVYANQAIAAAAAGIETTVLTSGAHKADGNPMVSMTDSAREALQQSVDAMADVFFDHVRQYRRGLDAAPLQARVFVGKAAVDVGLADAVMSWDQLTAALTSGAKLVVTSATVAASTADSESIMADPEKKDDDKEAAKAEGAPKWLKALRAAADEGDEDAKSALAEYETKRAGAKAEHEEPDGDEPPKHDAALAETTAKLAATVAQQGAELAAFKAEKAAREKADAEAAAAAERAAFFAANPHISAELAATFDGLSLDAVKGIVAKMPKVATPPNRAAELSVKPLAGGDSITRHSAAAAEMDRRFGFSKVEVPLVQVDGSRRVFSAAGITPEALKSVNKGNAQ